jgi:hypothetical protein
VIERTSWSLRREILPRAASWIGLYSTALREVSCERDSRVCCDDYGGTFEFSYNSLGWLYPLVKTTANIAIADDLVAREDIFQDAVVKSKRRLSCTGYVG